MRAGHRFAGQAFYVLVNVHIEAKTTVVVATFFLVRGAEARGWAMARSIEAELLKDEIAL